MTNNDSRLLVLSRWLRDRIWAKLDGPSTDTTAPPMTLDPNVNEDVLPLMFERLSDTLATETDRRRAVESKLVAAGTVAPIAVTLVLAVTTLLSPGRAQDFTSAGAITLALTAFYVALQFLRATLATITGLSRMSYDAALVSAVVSTGTASPADYLRQASIELGRRIMQHREATNAKVDQLALAHISIVNALVAFLIAILVLSAITVWEVVK